MIVIPFLKRLLLKVGHGWPVLLCADGFAPQSKPWMAGSALRGWIRAPVKATDGRFCFARMDSRKKTPPQNNRGPRVAGLDRVSFVETCSYARARQRLALWF